MGNNDKSTSYYNMPDDRSSERNIRYNVSCAPSRSAQLNLHDSNSIIVEDSRNIFRREFICCVADQETCLSDSTVADYDTPEDEDIWSAICLKHSIGQ
jgi:hypothetical protein